MRAKFGLRLATVFGLSTILISTFTIAMFYRQAIGAIRWEVETKMLEVTSGATHLVDPAVHSTIQTKGDEKSTAYKITARRLGQFLRSSPDIRHIFTLVLGKRPGELRYVIDVGDRPPILASVGTPYAPAPSKLAAKVFVTKKPVICPETRRDRWGYYRTSFAPITDVQGRVVAVLGLESSVDRALHQQRAITYGAAVSFMTAVALAVLLSAVTSARISKPILRLMAATRDIADGNLDCKLDIDSHDEIGSLAESFNSMIASLKETQNVLMERANRDGLTGLYNHRYFHERLSQELKRSVRYGRPLSLLMIDLDGFKAINDKMGHPAGDLILRNVSKVLASSIRDIDIAARYGGDEFAVILPETGLDEAITLAERIRHVVDEGDSPNESREEARTLASQYKLTVSIGVAAYPRHARQRDSLVAAADIAMYHAKNVSQNRVCSYDEVPGAGGTMDPCRIHAFLQSASVSTIAALAEAVDVKDHYTHGHSESVARYASAIADQLRLSPEEKFNVRIAALLHDVGKIGMPDSILKHTGTLSSEQRDLVRSHPSVGGKIVKQIPQLAKILPGIVYHHERYDGTGYPSKLAGERIPLIARIICVADAFDAMTSHRPYRKALSVSEAIAELRAGAGTQFDPVVVEALVTWLTSTEAKAA